MADRLRPLLRRTLRVCTTDNRIFLGTFAGTDQPLNIVLVNTEEYCLVPAQSTTGLYSIGEETDALKIETPDGRFVGQVLIPWKMVAKIEVDVGDVTWDMGYEETEYT